MKTAILFASSLLLLPACRAGTGQVQHELLVFGSAEVAHTPGLDEEATGIEEVKVAADVLFSLQSNSFKALGEFLLTNHEADLERFQLGWEPSDHSVLWAGRFHQTSSFWNTEHHHGQFLQTSVSRPASEEWEDEDGIIPQHFLGLLWEASWPIGGSRRLHSALGGGLAPVITPDGLEPFDLLEPDASGHELGFQARLAWQPHELDESGVGLLLADNDIAAKDAPLSALGPFDHIEQTVIGAYARGDWSRWRLQVTGYHVTTSFSGLAEASRQHFLVGYAQLERDLPHGTLVFARHENTTDAADNLYLQMIPRFVIRRSTLGGRWQFARSHALTLEMSTSDSREESFSEFRLQWSATLL